MNEIQDEILGALELHSVEHLRTLLDNGLDARSSLRGKPLMHWLIEMYTRSDRFPSCVRLLLERGAVLDDERIRPVLLDDAVALEAALRADRTLLEHRTDLVSAFTPLIGASLLHVAAEFGHANVARVLLAAGANVDARAALDAHGFDGHTPLFHTVNSHANRSEPILHMLLDAGARSDVRLAGLTWGRGFEWETTIFDVTPVSYAQLGLLPQMHRDEADIYRNVRRLIEARGQSAPPLSNVPNRYLQPRARS